MGNEMARRHAVSEVEYVQSRYARRLPEVDDADAIDVLDLIPMPR